MVCFMLYNYSVNRLQRCLRNGILSACGYIKFIIGFTIILAHMNISGKTQLSQLTPIDFIGNFVLGDWGVIYTDAIPLPICCVFLIGVFFISFSIISVKI